MKISAGCSIVKIERKRRVLLKSDDEQSDSHCQCVLYVHEKQHCEQSECHYDCHNGGGWDPVEGHPYQQGASGAIEVQL